MNIVEEYIPPNFSKIRPQVCHLLTYNKHVYTLNDNMKELYQKSDKAGTDMLSNQYSIINEFNTDYRLCQSWEDIKELVETYEPEDDKKEHTINIQYYGIMNQLAYKIVIEEK